MPKVVTKTIKRVGLAVATGGISEVVEAGKSIAKGDVIGAVTGGIGGLGAAAAIGGAANNVITSVKDGKTVSQAVTDTVIPKDMAKTEQDTEAKAASDERRRRQLLVQQGNLIRTSPLGAAIRDKSKLGGPTMSGY